MPSDTHKKQDFSPSQGGGTTGSRWVRLAEVFDELCAAASLALNAIDTVMPAHRGQHEYEQLSEAFAALTQALNHAEGRDHG